MTEIFSVVAINVCGFQLSLMYVCVGDVTWPMSTAYQHVYMSGCKVIAVTVLKYCLYVGWRFVWPLT